MTAPGLLVATHGHCFDGMASAALFTHFVRTLDGVAYDAKYRSCGYGPTMSAVPAEWLVGDKNAILDFRYTASDKLTWYFDHHRTAFGSTEERDLALTGDRVFYDPTYGSCTKLIADVARDRFGVDVGHADLVAWADRIDAARFDSAEAATDRQNPVLQLAAVVEHHGDGPFLNSIVAKLIDQPLIEVAQSAEIQALYAPIGQAQAAYVERVRASASVMGRVVLVDLTDRPLDVAAKFIAYALYPEATYSVTLSRSKHIKLSVGYNPWSGRAREHDISAICKRYGGGGHPVVGATTFPLAQIERAKEVAQEIVRELDGA
jgi:hypothetical protein